MHADAIADALYALGVVSGEFTALKDVPFANRSWLVEPQRGTPFAVRCYHDRATREELVCEHAVGAPPHGVAHRPGAGSQ